jgi:hypothetical protein
MYMDHNHDHNYFSRRMCMDQYVRDTLPKKHFGFTLKKKEEEKTILKEILSISWLLSKYKIISPIITAF